MERNVEAQPCILKRTTKLMPAVMDGQGRGGRGEGGNWKRGKNQKAKTCCFFLLMFRPPPCIRDFAEFLCPLNGCVCVSASLVHECVWVGECEPCARVCVRVCVSAREKEVCE